ncbi:MAG: hypothetical protein P8Y45_01355 [Exilibacterium sp.]
MRRLFQHGHGFQPHAQVLAQRRLAGVAGVNQGEGIAGQSQAQLHCAGVLIGAARAAGNRVLADADQYGDVEWG